MPKSEIAQRVANIDHEYLTQKAREWLTPENASFTVWGPYEGRKGQPQKELYEELTSEQARKQINSIINS